VTSSNCSFITRGGMDARVRHNDVALTLVNDQAVIVNVPLHGAGGDFADLQDLGERLAERVDAAGVGEFDGDMVGEDRGVIYLYGPDADRLWLAVEDVLRAASPPAGTYAVKQYGPPGSQETRVDL
jgi:hypothetical protein